MALTTPRHQRVTATALAYASTLALALGALWGGLHTCRANLETTDDVLAAAFSAVATMCLARLSWICAGAARDVLASEATQPVPSRAEDRALAATGPTTPGRARAASLFLALAALMAAGAGTATAAPPPVTASSAPSPDFTSSPSPDLVPSPTASTTHSPRDGNASVSSAPAAPTASGADCPTPEPGWTPPTNTVDEGTCRLVLPGSGAEGAHGHVVLRGQTLWSIAAGHLPQDAPAEVVASAVRTWIEANPELKDDPDLIHPGDVLTVPASASVGGTR